MTLPDLALWAALPVLGTAMLLAAARLVRGPSLPDRVVALDLMSVIAIGIIAVHAILTRNTALLDVVVVLALISFLATMAFANYLQREHVEE